MNLEYTEVMFTFSFLLSRRDPFSTYRMCCAGLLFVIARNSDRSSRRNDKMQ